MARRRSGVDDDDWKRPRGGGDSFDPDDADDADDVDHAADARAAADDSDDLDDSEDDGPSREDLRRFGAETAHCPACGAEIFDDAVQCPQCDEIVAGMTSRRPPWQSWWRQRWLALIVVLLVLAMLGVLPYLLTR